MIQQYLDSDFDSVVSLYEQVGWGTYTNDLPLLRQALRNSGLVLIYKEESSVIGLIRIITDNSVICYIQDILVSPNKHRHGVGTALMKEILSRYSELRQIVLLTDDDQSQEKFYESLGFDRVEGKLRSYARLLS